MNLKATDSDHISTQYNRGSQLWTKWFSSQETFSVVTTGGADASGIYWTEASNAAKYPTTENHLVQNVKSRKAESLWRCKPHKDKSRVGHHPGAEHRT